MKYVLVEIKSKEIVTKVELASEVGLSGARTYFKGVKRLEGKKFDELWEVMTELDYKSKRATFFTQEGGLGMLTNVSRTSASLMIIVLLMMAVSPMKAQQQSLPASDEESRNRLNSSPRHGEWLKIES